MTLPEQLQLAGIAAIIVGWGGKGIWRFIRRDVADTDMQAQAKVLWSRVDTMRSEVEDLKQITAVLESRIEGLPDFERWDQKLNILRTRLEDKLDTVSGQLTETLVQLAKISHAAGERK
jgi:hypothetical protein